MDKLKLGYKIFFLVIIGLALGFLLTAKKKLDDKRVFSAASISVTPTVNTLLSKVEKEKMESPDGTRTLTMTRTDTLERINYELHISDVDINNEHSVWSTEEDKNYGLEIPYNTWSPDNKYFFLKETSSGSIDYLVLFTSGEFFPEEKKYTKIRELFSAKHPEYVIEDVTGWASTTNLLVNTLSQEKENVSFWFDVTSQTFTRLSTYFR